MSHRRGGLQKESVIAVEKETAPFGSVLDEPPGISMDRVGEDPLLPVPSGSLSLDARYEAENQSLMMKQWKEGYFATGMTATTWGDEYQKWRHNFRDQCLMLDDNDKSPCSCCSAVVCGLLGAGRVGNMAILKQSTEWVEEEEEDENGEVRTKRVTRPRLDVVVGPYWPMLCLVTYPLIFGVSLATLITAIPGKHFLIVIFWAACTLGLIYALAMTSFRDPGILPRHIEPPPKSGDTWRWSDRAHSFRPRGAWYDPDTGVIVEGFDHTCWWSGGPIGKKNRGWFKVFLILMYTCLLMDTMYLVEWYNRRRHYY